MTDNRLSKVRAEIERLKEIAEYNLSHCKMDRGAWMQQASVCTKLLSFIDSMQEEPVGEELEEEALVYAATGEISLEGKLVIDEEIYETFKAGAQWQKQQMMKDAVDVEVWDEKPPHITYFPKNLKGGDKVKLIIIKDGQL